jgi:hypothetical protein
MRGVRIRDRAGEASEDDHVGLNEVRGTRLTNDARADILPFRDELRTADIGRQHGPAAPYAGSQPDWWKASSLNRRVSKTWSCLNIGLLGRPVSSSCRS